MDPFPRVVPAQASAPSAPLRSDLPRLLETRDGSEQTLKQHLWGARYIDELVQVAVNTDPATDNTCDAPYYAMQNANFNVLGITDADGVLVERYEYTPYGQRTVYRKSGPDDALTTAPLYHSQQVATATARHPYTLCDIGHQGLRVDREWEAYDNRLRPWLPSLARWPQVDPSRYLDGANLFEYVRSNPVTRLDPTGMSELEWTDYQEVIITTYKEGITDFNVVFQRLMQAYFDADKDNDTFWDCEDDMEEIWEAVYKTVDDPPEEYRKQLAHAGVWRDTFPGDDGSTISHFFGGAAWGDLGPMAQDAFEAKQDGVGPVVQAVLSHAEDVIVLPTLIPRPSLGDADTTHDTAAAYLGSKVADIFDTWSECRCRCIARKFKDGKITFTSLFGREPKHVVGTMRGLANRRHVDLWVEARIDEFRLRIKDCYQ